MLTFLLLLRIISVDLFVGLTARVSHINNVGRAEGHSRCALLCSVAETEYIGLLNDDIYSNKT